MLENEPEGGERTGSQPAGDTADQSTTADGAAVGDRYHGRRLAAVEPAGAERLRRRPRRSAARATRVGPRR